MKQFLITVCGVFLGLMLFLIGAPILIISLIAGQVGSQPKTTPDPQILMLDLRGGVSDQSASNLMAQFSGSGSSVVGIVTKLMAAEGDKRVKTLIVRAPEGGLDAAAAEEINRALGRLKASGKTVVAHSQGIYSPIDYMSISSASEIWMQASSDFAATGLSMETPFFRALLDRFDAKPEMMHFYEYKNAAAPLLEKTYTPAHREAETALLGSIFDTIVDTTARDRKLTPDDMRATLTSGPLSPTDAMAAKLIDRIGYTQDAIDSVFAAHKSAGDWVDLADYQPEKSLFDGRGATIALIEGEGPIMTGQSQGFSFNDDAEILSDDTTDMIYAAADDKDVRAIVFRVSSPGGSPVASDQIWAALEYAKKQGKPVVVSMGAYGASGGYYVAAGADEIIANATTITGSIGVVGGKVALHDTFARYGVNMEEIRVGGEFAGATASTPYTPAQREQMRGLLARIYADFTAKVAVGRDLPIDTVREVAKGRVWSGSDARARKLIDHIGGLGKAIERAKALAKITDKDPVHLRRFTPEHSPFDVFAQVLHGNISILEKLRVLSVVMDHPQMQAMSQSVTASRTPAQLQAPVQQIQ